MGTAKVVLFALLIAAGAVAGFFGLPYLTPPPEAVHPENPGQLDPAVKALITPMIAKAEAFPRDASAHAELGVAYEANGLWREAYDSYANATQLDKKNLEWHLHGAIVARQAGHFDSALQILKDQATLHPSSAPILHHLGDALLEAGEMKEAEAAFRKVIELAPRAAQGYVGLGDIMVQLGAGEAAVEVLEQAIALNPGYRQAHYLFGRALGMVGREEEAAGALARGLDANVQYLPDGLSNKLSTYTVNATGRISQASALLNAGNPQQAAQLLEESYQYHNTNVMLLNTLASAYLQTSRLDDAHRLLVRARDLDHQQFFSYLNLYTWALRSGKNEDALAFAEEAITHAPARDDTHLARAQALTQLGRFDEALVSATKALEIDGQKAANHGLAGDINFRLERFAAAATHFDYALAINGNLLPALIGQAHTKWALGQRNAARQFLVRAQQLAPNHPRVLRAAREMNGN